MFASNSTKILTTLITMLFLILPMSCNTSQVQIEQNIEIAKQIIEAYNSQDVSKIDDLVAENYAHHWNTQEKRKTGPEVIKEDIKWQWQFASDVKFTIEDIVANENNVTLRFIYEGAFESLGKKASAPGIILARFESGKLIESWIVFDRESLLVGLGYSITPPTVPENN